MKSLRLGFAFAALVLLGLTSPAFAGPNLFVDSAGNRYDGQTVLCPTGTFLNGSPVVAACSNIGGGPAVQGAGNIATPWYFLFGTGATLPDPVASAPVSTTAAASALVLKASAGSLLSLVASSTAGGWIMIFDAVSAPADGVVSPKWAYPVAAGGAFSMAWPVPLIFSTGIVVVFSTTGPYSKTASTTAFISGQVR